jgi:cobalt-zinc-cadmium efflux system outer membrane protein
MRPFGCKTIIVVVLLSAMPCRATGAPINAVLASSAGPASSEILQAVINLATLEQMALERNPTMLQARAQVELSRGRAIQAGLLPNPSVGYVAEQIGVADTAGELHGMFFEQEIITGGKLQLSRAKFMQEARQAELQVLAQYYRVLCGARTGFYETLAWQRRVQLRRRLLAVAEEATVTVRELTNVGQANQSDVLRAQVEQQRARAEARRAERRFQGSWEELLAVVGVPELAAAQLEDTLDIQRPERLDRDVMLQNLLSCSPQLQFARADVARDKIALERERAEPIPDVSVRAETGYNFEADDTVAGIEVGLRFPVFDKNQGSILQAQAELARATAEVQRVELMLRKRFAETFAEYEASRDLAETYRREILPAAEQVYQANLNSFKERRAAWPQVVDAQREYFELYEMYLDELLAARRAEVKLRAYLLDDGLQQPPEPSPAGHRDSTPRPR